MKKNISRILLLLLSVALLSVFLCSCQADEYTVTLQIEGYGDIVIRPDRKVAPISTANFISLAKSGFYDGLTFHRIADLTGKGGVIIQGGDPKGDGSGNSSSTITGEFAANGINNPLSHVRGTVSMARSADYDSASCQFFICAGDCSFLDGNYAAFGTVIEGMDVVDKLAAVKTNTSNKPLTSVVIKKATVRGVGYPARFGIALGATAVLVVGYVLVYQLLVKPAMEAAIAAAIGTDKRSRAKLEKSASALSSLLYLHAKDMIGAQTHRWFMLFTYGCLLLLPLAWVCCYAFYLYTWIPTAVILLATAACPLLFARELKEKQANA